MALIDNHKTPAYLRQPQIWLGIALLLSFLLFKRLYTAASFIPDSYSYIAAAYHNMKINIWPIGYSKVLRFVSVFTHSQLVLVWVQYLSLQLALFYLINRILKISVVNRYTKFLIIAAMFNPIVFYISNMITSDAFFIALSIVWFAQLLDIIFFFKTRTLWTHVLVLALVFTFRYNGFFYPIISIGIILFSAASRKAKLATICGILFAIGAFIINTTDQYKEKTNTEQFSAFGGWQLAANSLYMYSHLPQESGKDMPANLQVLHTMVNKHLDSLNRLHSRPDSLLGIYYLWDEKAPLKSYLRTVWQKDTTTDYFIKYASMGNVFRRYGQYLISHHPLEYFRYFIVPNFKAFYVPPPEFLSTFNMGSDKVDTLAQVWFDLNSKQVQFPKVDYGMLPIKLMPIAFALVNCFYLASCLGFFYLFGLFGWTNLHKLIYLTLLIAGINMVFSITASPIVLRYQIFPLFVFSLTAFVVFDKVLSNSPDNG
ncbi:hypothetical protein [Chitinophaga sancti]|uniref:Dolichyl-phosphate-mannose-protein mannosyltransferase n=1 Tax=Chitinophaga sancti TaxID=1004 RepID=A0A1K1T2K5_9BACT|nr:hypothetical protein [Chitinophaga sancti]WQD59535.1 hypothetical protein U0033_16705 [Chitinophaga sancti]WQG88331.1 hypothetical protein SR876_25760 [Chitinophaga sancti]SFW90740.1 hypothetical protein SAMN05661012_06666 [Chitinophaga sancti]